MIIGGSIRITGLKMPDNRTLAAGHLGRFHACVTLFLGQFPAMKQRLYTTDVEKRGDIVCRQEKKVRRHFLEKRRLRQSC